jgi:hypothetical protein
MGNRMNFAPRLPTIIMALALMLIGLLGAFAGVLPSIAGLSSEAIDAWALLAAGAVLLLGMVFEGI